MGPTNTHRVVRLEDPIESRRMSIETVDQGTSAIVRVSGTLDAIAARDLAEHLGALLARGTHRLILDARKAAPVPRIVDALSGVAFALEGGEARLALVGRRGEVLSALVTLRANGIAGAIYVFDSIDDATRGVGLTDGLKVVVNRPAGA